MLGKHLRSNVVGYVAVFIALTAGAYAAGLPKNSVKSSQIKDGQVKTKDLHTAAVATDKLADNSVTQAKLAAGAVSAPALGQTPAARVELTANQSIAHLTPTMVAFDREVFDTQDLHSNAAATRLTAPIPGLYDIGAGVEWRNENTSGQRIAGVMINGATVIAREHDSANTVAGARHSQNVGALYPLNAGDYAEVQVLQSSGGPLDITNASITFLSMRWVAPLP